MNEAISGYLLFALIILALFVYPWYFRCLHNLSVLMEERYAQEWELLGSPSINKSMGLSAAVSLLKFIWTKSYMSFEDSTLVNLGNKSRYLLMTGIFIFVMFFVVSWMGV